MDSLFNMSAYLFWQSKRRITTDVPCLNWECKDMETTKEKSYRKQKKQPITEQQANSLSFRAIFICVSKVIPIALSCTATMCEHRRISDRHLVLPKASDSRKYVCVKQKNTESQSMNF